MRYYYDTEFTHIIDCHQHDIMGKMKEFYVDDVMNLIESFVRYQISERDFVDMLKEYIIAAAELIYEDHEPGD